MKNKILLFLAISSLFSVKLLASGFALYQPSAKTQALGGAVIGRAVDASANFWNPATLSDITNVTVTLGFITEHPRTRISVNDGSGYRSSIPMNSGLFALPHTHLAVPLPWDTTFGLSLMPEYGLGSKYPQSWPMSWNTYETTVQSLTLNPNLSYSITDKWSVGAGMRFIWFDFEQFAHVSPLTRAYVSRLKGDNDMKGLGWQIGTRYKLLDNLSFGLVYKSITDIRVRGRVRSNYPGLYGKADSSLRLPQSITGGFNWDITDTVHLGASLSWTDWSDVNVLTFELPIGDVKKYMRWDDTWRAALGVSWDFATDWTVMGSYVYDMNCTGDQQPTMLPPADRHALAAGIAWQCTDYLEFGLTYALIIFDGDTMSATDSTGKSYRMEPHRGLSHAAGFSVTFRF